MVKVLVVNANVKPLFVVSCLFSVLLMALFVLMISNLGFSPSLMQCCFVTIRQMSLITANRFLG